MSESSVIRHRGSRVSEPENDAVLKKIAKTEDKGTPVLLEAARTLLLLFVISSALSYFVTREDIFWGVKQPAWTRPEVLKTWLVSFPFFPSHFTANAWGDQNGPQEFTDEDLKNYDGSNPDLPIYLAINGTIYDVSVGRRHYGPGGSYHFFAGADASRAFVTNCFQEDITPDMRGVEEMFLPLDDEEVDSLYTNGQLKVLKQQERKIARDQVHANLKHWVDFFEGSGKYTKVGRVKREKGWETKGEKPKLCAKVQEGRRKRDPPSK